MENKFSEPNYKETIFFFIISILVILTRKINVIPKSPKNGEERQDDDQKRTKGFSLSDWRSRYIRKPAFEYFFYFNVLGSLILI